MLLFAPFLIPNCLPSCWWGIVCLVAVCFLSQRLCLVHDGRFPKVSLDLSQTGRFPFIIATFDPCHSPGPEVKKKVWRTQNQAGPGVTIVTMMMPVRLVTSDALSPKGTNFGEAWSLWTLIGIPHKNGLQSTHRVELYVDWLQRMCLTSHSWVATGAYELLTLNSSAANIVDKVPAMVIFTISIQ